MNPAIKTYLKEIEQNLLRGDSTEHTHRPALKNLLQSFRSGIIATNEPTGEKCGAPDLAVSIGRGHGPLTIGHVEAKDVGKRLAEEEDSEQMRRYRRALENLIFTDYLEFRWYVAGERRLVVTLARIGKGGKVVAEKDGEEKLTELLELFLAQMPQPIAKPRDLAVRMARLTHMIRDIIVTAFEEKMASSMLKGIRTTFAETLIPGLQDPEKTGEFADMFAQTLAYGLFAARCNHQGPEPFERLRAAKEIPKTNPFLRQLFETITGTALDDEPFAGFVDDLTRLLSDTDMGAILADFGKRTRQQDPVVHFYETFLAEYDPKLRAARGVYYTPEPVVSYIVRSVDDILRKQFSCPDGLAETTRINYERLSESGERETVSGPKVLILDPACGTGTFLYGVVDHIRDGFMLKMNTGMWSGYVSAHLLPRLYGFELLMAPYAVAHFKLGMQLAAQDLPEAQRRHWAYDFATEERLGIYLTNSLEEAKKHPPLPMGKFISDEANAATDIKREDPIMVVLGNPPYSGHSANTGKWIHWLLKGKDILRTDPEKGDENTASYFQVDGKDLGERNPKWLNDDYVKFIRFAQWRIEQTGYGVLAFITNHGYLDNPTFRGMRQSLMQTFDDIYILNLHGNSKKKEKAPDGSKDENVFDIQQGVAIGIFVKKPGGSKLATVRHAELWGARDDKYDWLKGNDSSTTEWETLEPQTPLYLFAPQDMSVRAEYEASPTPIEVMPVNVLGFQTHREHFAVDFDGETIRRRIGKLLDTKESDAGLRETFNLTDNRDWHLSKARRDLRADAAWGRSVIRCAYRPLDWRFCYFSTAAMDYPRRELLNHVAGRPNLCLGIGRQGIAVNDPT